MKQLPFKQRLCYLIQMAGSCVNQVFHSSHSSDACSSQHHLGGRAIAGDENKSNLNGYSSVWQRLNSCEIARQWEEHRTVGFNHSILGFYKKL